jgi:hypothetical protein
MMLPIRWTGRERGAHLCPTIGVFSFHCTTQQQRPQDRRTGSILSLAPVCAENSIRIDL